MNIGKTWSKDKKRCLISLKYTKPKTNNLTIIFIRLNNKKTITMWVKKVLIWVYICFQFPKIDDVKY